MIRRELVLCMRWVGLLIAGSVAAVASAAEEHPLLKAPLTQAPGRQLMALTVTYASGQSTRPHHHGGDAFVYVLTGHIRSQVEGSPERVYGPGESWFEPAGAHHVVSGNASAEQPASMLVVFVAKPEAELTAMDQPPLPARTQSR
ncbi:Cupin domain protein [Dyella sp. OK004]|uniref:cupin domain-containing protein n=1 Tax=Dyella sp. OK004 TaxID=1855292 RepID=UPI0008E0A37C|nr:cupin domain-containing protein [Dyella sp. OK004]SFS17630.1 Cupin domain protein [Dyella sp. OK004]